MCSESALRADGRNPGVALAGTILESKTRRHAGLASGAFIIDRTPTGVCRRSLEYRNIATLNEDIARADSASSGSFTITLSSDIVEKEELDLRRIDHIHPHRNPRDVFACVGPDTRRS